jgi:hypothetical protein
MQKEIFSQIKDHLLSAKNVGQLAAIINDYTHADILLVYQKLNQDEQRKIQLLWQWQEVAS